MKIDFNYWFHNPRWSAYDICYLFAGVEPYNDEKQESIIYDGQTLLKIYEITDLINADLDIKALKIDWHLKPTDCALREYGFFPKTAIEWAIRRGLVIEKEFIEWALKTDIGIPKPLLDTYCERLQQELTEKIAEKIYPELDQLNVKEYLDQLGISPSVYSLIDISSLTATEAACLLRLQSHKASLGQETKHLSGLIQRAINDDLLPSKNGTVKHKDLYEWAKRKNTDEFLALAPFIDLLEYCEDQKQPTDRTPEAIATDDKPTAPETTPQQIPTNQKEAIPKSAKPFKPLPVQQRREIALAKFIEALTLKYKTDDRDLWRVDRSNIHEKLIAEYPHLFKKLADDSFNTFWTDQKLWKFTQGDKPKS